MCSDGDYLEFIGVDKVSSRVIFDSEVADALVPSLVFSEEASRVVIAVEGCSIGYLKVETF